jgi:hypothetical protein
VVHGALIYAASKENGQESTVSSLFSQGVILHIKATIAGNWQ